MKTTKLFGTSVAASVLAVLVASGGAVAQTAGGFRPPAVPLVTHDPYFSVWSSTDLLTGGWARHWTGATMGMCGLVRIDGKAYRWCGAAPQDVPALMQKNIVITPTTTTYEFIAEEEGVKFSVTFGSPIGMGDDIVAASRPVSYVQVAATATDGKSHDVRVYLDCSGEWVVNTPDQQVTWSRVRLAGMDAVNIGTQSQQILGKAGDNLRVDWGRMYLAIPRGDGRTDAAKGDVIASSHGHARGTFTRDGTLPSSDDTRMPRAANDDYPVLAGMIHLGKVRAAAASVVGGERERHRTDDGAGER